MVTAQKVLESAKTRLIMQEPFFATLALQKTYIADPSAVTACINGKVIRYAPDFIAGLSVEECATLIAHECMHPAMLHHLRRNGRDPQQWNRACDYAINLFLQDAKLKLPEVALVDERFRDKSAEDIFDTLEAEKPKPEPEEQDEQQEQEGEGSGSGAGDGQKEDQQEDQDSDEEGENGDSDSSDDSEGDGDEQNSPPESLTEDSEDSKPEDDQSVTSDDEAPEIDPTAPENWGRVEDFDGDDPMEEAEEQKQQVAMAVQAAQMQGKGSAGLERMVAELLAPKISWKEVMQRFLAEVAANDYSWARPNNRYLPSGIYLPSLNSLELGRVVFVVDTSGSIDTKALDQFASELKDAMTCFRFPVTVIYADDSVAGVEELDPEDDLHPVGYGGTDYRPAFDYIRQYIEDEVRAIIYFTDGWCDSFPSLEPDTPVLWAVTERERFNPPFGEVVRISDD